MYSVPVQIAQSFGILAAQTSVITANGLLLPQHPLPPCVNAGARTAFPGTQFLRSIGVDMTALAFTRVGDRFDMMRHYHTRFNFTEHPSRTRLLTSGDLPHPFTPDEVFYHAPLTFPFAPQTTLASRSPTLIAYHRAESDDLIPFALIYDAQGEIDHKTNPGVINLSLEGDRRDDDRTLLRKTSPLTHQHEASFPAFPTTYEANTHHGRALMEASLPQLRSMRDRHPEMKILVLGIGSGLEIAYFSHLHDFRVDAVDINPIAVMNALTTATYLGVDPRLVRVWQSDLFDRVPERYDAIVFDAPLAVGSLPAGETTDLNIRDVGGTILTRTLAQVADHLVDGGALFLQAAPDIRRYRPRGLRDTIIARPQGQLARWENFAIHRMTVQQRRWWQR